MEKNIMMAIAVVAVFAVIAIVYFLSVPAPPGDDIMDGINSGLIGEDDGTDIGDISGTPATNEIDANLMDEDYEMELGELM